MLSSTRRMLIRQAALLVMAACSTTWAHKAGCCAAPMQTEPDPVESCIPCTETAPMDTSATCAAEGDDHAPDAVRSFTLTIKVLQEMHAQTRAPRVGVRHASGDKYDNATIDSDFNLILNFWSATRADSTRCRGPASMAQAERAAQTYAAAHLNFQRSSSRSRGANLTT